jgi:hypothetical protein
MMVGTIGIAGTRLPGRQTAGKARTVGYAATISSNAHRALDVELLRNVVDALLVLTCVNRTEIAVIALILPHAA